MVVLDGNLKTISENLLNLNDYLVLLMPVGKSEIGDIGKDQTKPEMLAYFLKIIRSNPFFFRVSAGAIADDATTGPSVLKLDGFGGSAKDLFHTNKQNMHSLYHVAVRLSSTASTVKFGIENPANYVVTGMRTFAPPANDLTDKFGWYPANTLSYDASANDVIPTIATEQMILPNVQPRYAIRNESGGQITPNIEVFGATYRLVHITDPKAQDSILEKEMPNIHFKSYGGFRDFTPYIPEHWPLPVPITDEKYINALAI